MILVPKHGHARISSIPFAAIIVVAWQAQAGGLGCCFPDGSCTSAFGNACLHAGGTPVESCTPDACLGACCSDNQCTLTIADDCQLPLYYGSGTTCGLCLGACCLSDGGCAELTPSICSLQGGALQGLETYCADTTCVGACCVLDGSCEEIGPDPCASAGGAYQGRGTACEPVLGGDLDCDGSLLPEWNAGWLDCLRGPEQTVSDPRCDAVDLDIDGDVDLADVALLGLLNGYHACADVPFPCCGNGVVELGEHCDDGNTTPGDGCDGLCRSECVNFNWQEGQVVTFDGNSWGDFNSPAGQILSAGFTDVYSATFGVLEVGIIGSAGYSMALTSASRVFTYLPAVGTLGPLNQDLVDPTTSSSGAFGGEVVTLMLNIDFADAGRLNASTLFGIGDLTICGTDLSAVNGISVRDFAAIVNSALGGGPAPHTISELYSVLVEINMAFNAGVPSQWARDHLVFGPRNCVPGTPGCAWEVGDMVTYNQDHWGTIGTTASILLANYFFTVFTKGVVEVGIPGISGFSAIFGSANAVINYTPATGVPGPLNADLGDPTSTSSGVLGGHALALQIDVAFTDAGLVSGAAPLRFGDLRVCGLTDTPSLNGLTVRQVLDVMNTAIGGGSAPYSYHALSALAEELTQSFESGTVSQFAQDHLLNGPCPCTPGTIGCGWQDGDILTYTQTDWGDATTTAGVLLSDRFNALYGSAGYVEVGMPGSGGFSMLFTSAGAVFTYQPASGTPAPLNADLVDPTVTASGVFGGEVLALRFNIDLSDADFLSGTTNIDIGNLTLCGLAQTELNGTTVRAFQDVANNALGGGATPYAIANLFAITGNINASFSNDAVSPFAQDHLFNGTCPCTPGTPGCGWEDGQVVSYAQAEWGLASTGAGILLDANYGAVYASTFGIVEIGLSGAAGFSIQFTSADATFAYQPSSGAPAPLNADLVDPISTASGAFGGEVLALRFNIDFSDAGLTAGSAGLRFGDLTLCNPTVGERRQRARLHGRPQHCSRRRQHPVLDRRPQRAHSGNQRSLSWWRTKFVRAGAPVQRPVPVTAGQVRAAPLDLSCIHRE